MSNSEQFTQPLPVNDNVVVKLPQGTQLLIGNNILFEPRFSNVYESAEGFINKFIKSLPNVITPKEILDQGVKIEILEPGKQWKSGKLRCRLVFEFLPDEQENIVPIESISPLDDLRKMNL